MQSPFNYTNNSNNLWSTGVSDTMQSTVFIVPNPHSNPSSGKLGPLLVLFCVLKEGRVREELGVFPLRKETELQVPAVHTISSCYFLTSYKLL
jgi:hypothetical protein